MSDGPRRVTGCELPVKDQCKNDEAVQSENKTWSTWTGSDLDAVEAAENALNAEPQFDDTWVYHDDAEGKDYRVSRKALLAAGAAILAGATDWYSSWCANFEAEEVEKEEEEEDA